MSAPAIRRVLLVGAGYTARIVAAELGRRVQGPELVAVLDDAPARRGERIGSAEVIGPLSGLAEAARRFAVDEVIIAIPSLPGPRLREIALACRHLGLPVRTMPSIVELLGESLTPRQLRPIQASDLLRRTEVPCDAPAPAYAAGQRVLITGAGGSVGRELARQVCRAAPECVILLGHGENSIHAAHMELAASAGAPRLIPVIADITDRVTLARTFAEYKPTLVFHAAAHKHVPLMERQPAEAVRNNVVGTRNVLRCAETADVGRLLFVSTDKAVAPASIMGATKRVCEWMVRDAAVRTRRSYTSVRFGNVLGSRGSLVPVLEQQIARGGPITLTHPAMSRFFMTIPEAVYLVLQAGGIESDQSLFALNMGEPVRIVDLTEDLLALSGLAPGAIEIQFTGLRPGEKLAEALWEPGSVVEPIGRGELLRIREASAAVSGRTLEELVLRLARAARRGDAPGVHRLLRDALPTFDSSLLRATVS